jgi:hypothetical protein
LLDLPLLQLHFQDYLLEKNSLINTVVLDSENVSVATRLGIYHDAYYLRLEEVLQQNYAVLHGLMGCDEFSQLMRSYIQAYPSHFRSVRWYGSTLSQFMTSSMSPSMVELAQFEWLLTEVFDEVDNVPVGIAEMAAVAPEKWADMRFQLQPSLRKMSMEWNTIAQWKAYKEEDQVLAPDKNDFPVDCLIWRKEYEVQFCSVTVDEAYMLGMLIAGESFGAICEGLSEWVDEEYVAMHAATLLKRYIVDDLVVGIVVD